MFGEISDSADLESPCDGCRVGRWTFNEVNGRPSTSRHRIKLGQALPLPPSRTAHAFTLAAGQSEAVLIPLPWLQYDRHSRPVALRVSKSQNIHISPNLRVPGLILQVRPTPISTPSTVFKWDLHFFHRYALTVIQRTFSRTRPWNLLPANVL